MFSVSPTKNTFDAYSNVRHKNTATDEDDGIYEGVEFRPNSTSSKRRKSESPSKKVASTSNGESRLTDKATQTGLDDDEDEKKRKKSGNCVIL